MHESPAGTVTNLWISMWIELPTGPRIELQFELESNFRPANQASIWVSGLRINLRTWALGATCEPNSCSLRPPYNYCLRPDGSSRPSLVGGRQWILSYACGFANHTHLLDLRRADQCVAKTTTPRFATKIALTEPRNLHLWKQALQIIGTTSLGWVRLRAVKIEKVGWICVCVLGRLHCSCTRVVHKWNYTRPGSRLSQTALTLVPCAHTIFIFNV